MGCSNNHKLIANHLYFLDAETQVSSIHLNPNSLYYLHTLFRFLETKVNDSPDPSNHDHEGSVKADKSKSPQISSSSMVTHMEADGSLSITSNLQKLTSGKHYRLVVLIYLSSISCYNPA